MYDTCVRSHTEVKKGKEHSCLDHNGQQSYHVPGASLVFLYFPLSNSLLLTQEHANQILGLKILGVIGSPGIKCESLASWRN